MPQDELTSLQRTVLTMRIILFALVMGVAIFACLAVVIVTNQNRPLAPNNDLLTWVLIACAAAMLLMQLVLPPVIFNATYRRIAASPDAGTTERLLSAYRGHVIIGWAMCEGAAFTVLIGYLLEDNPVMLGIAGAAVLLMTMRLPTVNGISAFLERQRDALANRQPDELRTY